MPGVGAAVEQLALWGERVGVPVIRQATGADPAAVAFDAAKAAARSFVGAAYVSAGKTGTAQVIGIKQGEKYVESRVQEELRDHSLFIAYAPADEPRIALAVIVENAGFGARAAAPLTRKVLDYYLLGKLPAPEKRSKETHASSG